MPLPKTTKVKEPARPENGFTVTTSCTLPLWDDVQILQENWGAALTANRGGVVGRESVKPSKHTKDGHVGAYYTDREGRDVLEKFVESYSDAARPSEDNSSYSQQQHRPSHDESQYDPTAMENADAALIETVAIDTSPIDVVAQNSTSAPPTAAAVPEVKPVSAFTVTWQRPVDIVKPFRPVVHRNPTPFLNPYSSQDQLQPVDDKVEEARHRAESILAQGVASGKQRGGGSDAGLKDGGQDGPLHQLYPETVSLMVDLVGQDVSQWLNLDSAEAIRRYREVPALVQPYDPTLVHGCAETPAEACGSRYSTALRHKLRQAETLTALASIPPFLMSAFNSALLAVEQAQHLVGCGNYLWELIYPHAPGTCHPVYNPYGKYAVKLFVEGAYRKVLVDDALPVDELGRPLITLTSRKELWPAILAKAMLKAFASDATRILLEEPDVVVGCLLGNWIPEYVKAKRDGVSTAALLLAYKRHLPVPRNVKNSSGIEGMTEKNKLDNRNAAILEAFLERATPDALRPTSVSDKAKESSAEKRRKRSSRTVKSLKADAEAQEAAAAAAAAAEAAAVAAAEEEATRALESAPHSAIDDEAQLDARPLLVCGLRTSDPAYHAPGLGTGTQLYSIAAIVPFRNTLALHLRTSPRAYIEEGVFRRERDSKDVRDILVSTRFGQRTALQIEKDTSQTSCWLTLEELADAMESLVIWRCLDGRYTNQCAMEYGQSSATSAAASAMSATPAAAAGRKGGAGNSKGGSAGVAAAATQAAGDLVISARAPKKHSTMWWCVVCNRTEEVAIVVHAALPPPPLTPEEEEAATAAPPLSAPVATGQKKPSPRQAKAVGGKKGAAAAAAAEEARAAQAAQAAQADAAANASSPGQDGDADINSVSSTGFRSSRVGNHPVPLDTKIYQLDRYQWDRAEPLTRSITATYSYGKVYSTVLRLPAGTHVFRVTVPEMESGDKLTFLSNAVMELKADPLEMAKVASVFALADADVYPPVASPEEECVWFKRRLRVAETTRLTVVLSTLLPSEDPAAHRHLLQGPVAAKGLKTGNNTSTNAGGGRGGGGGNDRKQGGGAAPTPQKITITTRERQCKIPILRYVRLLLIDLDSRQETRIGEMGKLVQVSLSPNEKGYVLMAYARVPTRDVPLIISAMSPRYGSPVATPTSEGAATAAGVATTPAESLSGSGCGLVFTPKKGYNGGSLGVADATKAVVYPRGLWKLVVRSDHELAAFDYIAHGTNNVVESGALERSSGVSSLFKQTCTITETTHLSIIADLMECMSIPFTVRISSLSVNGLVGNSASGPASGAGASYQKAVEAATGSTLEVDSLSCTSSQNIVCDSGEQANHIFVPDVLLEIPDKVKNAVFLIEGYIPEECRQDWQEKCREMQESRYTEMRIATESDAEQRREQEVRAYTEDPAGFLAQKQTALQQAQQHAHAADNTDRSHKEGTFSASGNARRMRSVDRAKKAGSSSLHSGASPAQHRKNSVDASIGDSFGFSNVTPKSSPEHHRSTRAAILNAGPEEMAITFQLQLQLSNPRAELKDSMPSDECLNMMRAQWRGTMAFMREKQTVMGRDTSGSPGSAGVSGVTPPSGTGAPSTVSAPAATSTGGGKLTSRQSKEAAAAAAEILMRTEQAKLSRSRFLDNPKNVLIPFLQHQEDMGGTIGKDCGRNANNRDAGRNASLSTTLGHLVAEDSEENNFRHTAPFTEDQYRIKWLPIRASELCAAASGDAASGGFVNGGGAQVMTKETAKQRGRAAAKQGGGPTGSNATSTSGLSAGMGGGALSSAAVAPTTSLEDQEGLAALRAPLVAYTSTFIEACREQREEQRRDRRAIKAQLHEYWEQHPILLRDGSLPSDRAGLSMTTTVQATVPMPFPSIIGTKDDDAVAGRPHRPTSDFSSA